MRKQNVGDGRRLRSLPRRAPGDSLPGLLSSLRCELMGVLADIALGLDASRILARMDMEPDAWQKDLLSADSERTLWLGSRQAGKSTTAAVAGLHTALFKPGALVLLLSPSQRQSGELFRRVTDAYQAIGKPVPVKAESALRVEFENGSRVISLPSGEQTVRGFSGVNLLVIDEAARVDDNLYRAVRPMLAVSGGRLIALSTPFGRRGWFHQEWTEGQGWQRIRVTAEDCPRISREFLEQERASLGDWWFQQEYMCQFVDTGDSIFSYDLVHQALDDGLKPLFDVSDQARALLDQSDAPEPLFEETSFKVAG